VTKRDGGVLYLRLPPEILKRVHDIAEDAGVTLTEAGAFLITTALGLDSSQARLERAVARSADTPGG
jgi:hypothetical protein